MVGVIPLKVMGPPGIMVMVPITKQREHDLSALDTATMVTFAGEFVLFFCAGVMAVGTVSGAV